MVFILLTVIACCIGIWCFKSRGYADPRYWKAALITALLCLVVGLFFIPSLLVISKIITYLIMPLGLVWMTTFLACIVSKGYKRFLWGILFALITSGGNPWFGNFLLHSLERPFKNVDPLAIENLDAIVVLGGGTNDPSAFRPQLGYAGDRIFLAAELAQAQKTTTLVLTGSSPAQDHSEQTAELLNAIGVQGIEIIRVPEPMNTSQEIRAIKPIITTAQWQRVGVISSAWHLRRIMKLAEQNNIQLIPIPADIRGSWIDKSAHNLIPQADGIMATQLALKEYLGALVGR